MLLEDIASGLNDALALRSIGDIGTITAQWGEAASSHAAGSGFLVDPSADEFPAYVKALHDVEIEAWRAMLQRSEGEEVPTPAEPDLPQAVRGLSKGKAAPRELSCPHRPQLSPFEYDLHVLRSGHPHAI